DIRVHTGDGRGDVRQHGLAVFRDQDELDRIERALGADPLHLDAAIGVVEQVLDVGTVPGVHGDAFTARDVADDFLTPHGIAAPGAIDHQVVVAVHLDGQVGGDAGSPLEGAAGARGLRGFELGRGHELR